MDGVNLMFHVGAGAAFAGLAWLALRWRAQRDTLRLTRPAHRRLRVARPKSYVGGLAEAFGIRFECDRAGDLPARRVRGEALADVLWQVPVTLIRWRDGAATGGVSGPATVELAVAGGGGGSAAAHRGLEDCLGDGVKVCLIDAPAGHGHQ